MNDYSQLPIGVLFDMHYERQQQQELARNMDSTLLNLETVSINTTATVSSSSSSSSKQPVMNNASSSNNSNPTTTNTSLGGPWEIKIHFRRFPYDQLLQCDGDRIREQYFHSLKQALHLLHGSTRAFSALTMERRTDMWEGACAGDYSKFKPGFRELIPTVISAVRLLPVRLIRHHFPAIQKPITVFIPTIISSSATSATSLNTTTGVDSRETTLEDVLRIFFPTLEANTNTPENVVDIDVINHIFIQGVKVPSTAGIFEVWSILCSADLFLYLVIPFT